MISKINLFRIGLLVFAILQTVVTYGQDINKAYVHLNNSQHAQALDIFEQALQKNKHTVMAKYGMASIYADATYPKYNLLKAYNYAKSAEKDIVVLNEKSQEKLYKQHKMNNARIQALKDQITRAAYQQVLKKNNPDDLNTFISEYEGAPESYKAISARDSIAYLLAIADHTPDGYKRFMTRYPDAVQYNDVRTRYQQILLDEFKRVSADGELSSLQAFERRFPDFQFPAAVASEKLIAALGVSLNLSQSFVETKRASYDEFIRKSAPKELAFVALLRLIEQDIAKKDWTNAIATVKNYQPYFDDKPKKVNDLLQILQSNDQSATIQALSDKINTKGHEYLPVISADGNRLYFCGTNRADNYGGEDVYYSDLIGGQWSAAKTMDGVNTQLLHEAPLSVSVDGTKMLLYSSAGGGDINFTQRTADGWQTGRGIADINSNYWEADASFSGDGQAILFASARPGGFNFNDAKVYHAAQRYPADIYVSLKTASGWTRPINLGGVINTPFCDRSPFLHPDGRTLYFSSDGHGGLGGLDVYMSKRLYDTSWTHWSTPVNVGKAINTPNSEWGYKISTDGTTAYFSSPNGDNDDIYQLAIPASMRPDVVVSLQGKVTDEAGKPVAATVVWEDLASGIKMGEADTDPINGTFFTLLPVGKSYGFYAQAKGYFPVSNNIDLLNVKTTQKITHEVKLTSIDNMIQKGTSVRLNNLFFDTDKYDLRPESYPELQRVIEVLLNNASLKVEISGHTDNQGSDALNQTLSENRAKAVTDYLVKKGCNAANITAKGYGKNNPVSDNATDNGRALNRRVEMKFVK